MIFSMKCYVDGISHAGEGVARIDGKATFIPFALPGETVAIEIAESKKNYQRARLREVISKSPDRINPPCPHYYKCGGCSYQHVSYPRQLELKKQVVEDSLKRIGGIEKEVNPTIGMADPWFYRNKVGWHTGFENGKPCMGYYNNEGHQLINIERCLLISREMQDCSSYINEHLEESKVPHTCEVIVRQSSRGNLMLIFNADGAGDIDYARLSNHCQADSIYSLEQGITRLQHGETRLPEYLGDLRLEISPLAFFQVNHQQTQRMLQIIKEYAQISPYDIVLDAYCGTGTIALSLAAEAARVIGVESFPAAIKDAKRNAFNNNITNCKFIKGACEQVIPELEDTPDIIILDPPRSGCKKELIQAVINKSPRTIIYVSCNPATLARDLALFKDTNYAIKEIQPIDMFPQTGHVECVVLMSRVGK